jgi:hypothetical protein
MNAGQYLLSIVSADTKGQPAVGYGIEAAVRKLRYSQLA